jgi:WD40 repeat protein
VGGTAEGSAGWVTLLELPSGRRVSELPTHIRRPEKCLVEPLQPVVSLAFHPRDPYLMVGSEDAIWIWDAQHSDVVGNPLTHGVNRLGSLAVSPSGNAVVAGYEDGSVILWSLDTEEWRTAAARIANRELTVDERQRFIGATTNEGKASTESSRR